MLLKCENLSLLHRSYNDAISLQRYLCRPINLVLESGDIINICGKNGIGKTSFLKVLAGINPQYVGEYLCDEDILFIPDHPVVDMELTVQQNLDFWGGIYNAREKVEAMSIYLGLWAKKDVPVSKLSKGWIARVNLAKVMLCNAKVLLLDEPFANLDAEGCLQIKNLILAKAQSGGVVLFSSQNKFTMQEAAVYELQVEAS